MQGLPFVLLFTALTFLSWGAYGPLLRYGTTAMGHDGLKAFVGVGLAYFVIAVLVPFWILQKKGEKGNWTLVGTTYSIVAGSVGAIGALGIILALVFKGSPVFVMPLVFGFAPIVNTLVTAWMSGTLNKISPIFVGGIMAAALGAGGVLYFKPPAKPAAMLTKAGHSAPAETKSPAKEIDNTPIAETLKPSQKELKIVDKVAAPKEKPSEPSKSNEPTQLLDKPTTETTTPAKPVEAAPLIAAQPAEGSPPVPVKPIVASRPADGQPPVPAKPEPGLIATMPDAGQPPQPEEVKAPKQTASPKSAGSDVPPPVVNPDSDPVAPTAQPTKPEATKPEATKPEATKPEATKPEATSEAQKPAAAPAKELPPPVPNPEADLQTQRHSRPTARFVSTLDVQGTAPASDNHGSQKKDEKDSKTESAAASTGHHDVAAKPNGGMIALSILMAAICWGSYGPMLHKGQMKMGGSRLRPFACVGIAYFIIAVAVPLVLLYTTPTISQGDWTVKGLSWSVIAGGAGAIGALGIILAFNAGGKPIYVMPLVFGFAPVINTFISLTEAGTWSEVETMFWISLGVVIAGAITVLITAPKAAHGPAHAAAPAGAK